MNRLFLAFLLLIPGIKLTAQQIKLCGVVSVQNSRTHTGKTQFVKNVQIEHDSAKTTLTDDEGAFCLYIFGISAGRQTSINVTFPEQFSKFDIVNNNAINDITLGRKDPVKIYICPKGELEERRARMVDINIRKYQEIANKQIARLEIEKQSLYTQLKFSDDRLTAIEDSLRYINERKISAFDQIRMFSEVLVKENLDDKEENFVKAYNCFSHGELDSVQYYLNDSILELKYQSAQDQFDEGDEMIKLGQLMQEKANEEINEIIESWMLRAKAYSIQNKHDEAFYYFEKAVNADTTDFYNSLLFAYYLYNQKQDESAFYYFWNCVDIYEQLSDYGKEYYKKDYASILDALGLIYKRSRNYYDSEIFHQKSYNIFSSLGDSAEMTVVLHHIGDLYWVMNLDDEAINYFERSVETSKSLRESNKEFFYIRNILNFNAIGYLWYQKYDYHRAELYLISSTKYYDSLELISPGIGNPYYSNTLRHLGILYRGDNQLPKALEYHKRSYDILQELNHENPQAIESELSDQLYNLGLIETDLKNYNQAINYLSECRKIRSKLAVQDSLVYSDDLASIYYALGWAYHKKGILDSAKFWYLESLDLYEYIDGFYPSNNERPQCAILCNLLGTIYQKEANYDTAFIYYFWVYDVLRQLTKHNMTDYGEHYAWSLDNIASCYNQTGNNSKALKYYNKSLKIWRCLVNSTSPRHSSHYYYKECLKILIEIAGDLDKPALSRKYQKELNSI